MARGEMVRFMDGIHVDEPEQVKAFNWSGLVIYKVHCREMAEDGYQFFLSANHVWLTKVVPACYLRKMES